MSIPRRASERSRSSQGEGLLDRLRDGAKESPSPHSRTGSARRSASMSEHGGEAEVHLGWADISPAMDAAWCWGVRFPGAVTASGTM